MVSGLIVEGGPLNIQELFLRNVMVLFYTCQQNDDCFCEREALLLLRLKPHPLRGLIAGKTCTHVEHNEERSDADMKSVG